MNIPSFQASAWLISLPLLPLAMLPTMASAQGLTGSFALNQWQLIRKVNGVQADVLALDPSGPPQNLPRYLCADSNDRSCVDVVNADGVTDFTIVGSAPGDIGGVNDEVAINWTLVYQGAFPARLSFDWDMFTGDPESRDKGYFQINGQLLLNPSSTSSGVGFVSPRLVNFGDTVVFGVLSTDNAGNVGEFTISNFNATEVPAPLPLLGAGAALGWSRRLRRRIRSRVAMASR